MSNTDKTIIIFNLSALVGLIFGFTMIGLVISGYIPDTDKIFLFSVGVSFSSFILACSAAVIARFGNATI